MRGNKRIFSNNRRYAIWGCAGAATLIVGITVYHPSDAPPDSDVQMLSSTDFPYTPAEYFGLAGALHNFTYQDGPKPGLTVYNDFQANQSKNVFGETTSGEVTGSNGQPQQTSETIYSIESDGGIMVDGQTTPEGVSQTSYVVIPGGLSKGFTWSYSNNGDNDKATILGLANVTTPVGRFQNCLVIGVQDIVVNNGENQTFDMTYYYAPNVGLVKEDGMTNGNIMPILTLQNVVSNSPSNTGTSSPSASSSSDTTSGTSSTSDSVAIPPIQPTVYNQPSSPLTFGNIQVKTVTGSFKLYEGSWTCTYPEILYNGKVVWDAKTAFKSDPTNKHVAPTVNSANFQVLHDINNNVYVSAEFPASADGNDIETVMGGVSQSGKLISQFSNNADLTDVRFVAPDTMQYAYQQINRNLPAYQWDQGNWVTVTYSLPALKKVSQTTEHTSPSSATPWSN